MPDRAIAQGLAGTVVAQALLRRGRLHDVVIVSGPEVFHQAVLQALRSYRCTELPGPPVRVQQSFRFDAH